MAADKIYGEIEFTEDELNAVRSSVNSQRADVFRSWRDASHKEEKDWYSGRVDFYDALIKKLEKPFDDDSSQDDKEVT